MALPRRPALPIAPTLRPVCFCCQLRVLNNPEFVPSVMCLSALGFQMGLKPGKILKKRVAVSHRRGIRRFRATGIVILLTERGKSRSVRKLRAFSQDIGNKTARPTNIQPSPVAENKTCRP
jgi:hypothetical protein